MNPLQEAYGRVLNKMGGCCCGRLKRLHRALYEVPVAPAVTVNSIIAVEGEGPVEEGYDGVVEYASAHIEAVESELVVTSGHST